MMLFCSFASDYSNTLHKASDRKGMIGSHPIITLFRLD
jgi:hypothetical protein